MRAFLLNIFLFTSCLNIVDAQATLYAHIEDEKVFEGAYFKVEFQLKDARGNNFRAPDFKGLKVASGPARSFQTTVVNGKANSFESYSYTLVATKAGKFTIGQASIVVNGKLLKSNPLTIKVLPPLKQEDLLKSGTPTDKDFFVTAELSQDTGTVGQQFLLDYRIFTKINVDNVDFRRLPDLSDFNWNQLQLYNETVDQVEISGEMYSTKLLRRYALFPKRSGVYELGPTLVLLMTKNKKRRGFFFDNYNTKNVNTNPLTLTVNELPKPTPDNFSGLVGSYTMESIVGKGELTTDDAITVRMRIKGDGDPNLINLKPIHASPGLEVYDPKILAKNKDENLRRKDHYADVEYLFTAAEAGIYYVQPTFTYFDADSLAYVTLRGDSTKIYIKSGLGARQANRGDTSVVYQRLDARASSFRPMWIQHRGVRLAWIALVIAALFMSFLKWKQIRDHNRQPPKSDRTMAIEALDELESSNADEIAHRIEEILGDYYRKSLQIDESNWSTTVLKERLMADNTPEDRVDQLVDLLERCKFAAYSGLGEKQQSEWIEDAKSLLF